MLKSLYKKPSVTTIKGRSSSITNAFVNGIIPSIVPTEDEIREVLSVLGMDENTICCAYCGDKMTEWDHFRPIIINQRATGYISEIANQVPSCGKCNQSKRNAHWKTWMLSGAEKSPASRNIKDLDIRIKRLEDFESRFSPTKIDIEEIVGKELYDRYWTLWEELLDKMQEAQKLSDELKTILQKAEK